MPEPVRANSGATTAKVAHTTMQTKETAGQCAESLRAFRISDAEVRVPDVRVTGLMVDAGATQNPTELLTSPSLRSLTVLSRLGCIVWSWQMAPGIDI